ncbi:MAG: NAD+ synthase [Actinobacteria bacterium]|nr:NAD+ synthase [Actinomycetota bacterium]
MSDSALLRFGLAQIDPTVGDFERNADLIARFIDQALDEGVDVVVFPELALSGYPPEDLLLKSHFLEEARKWLNWLLPECRGITAVIGCPVYCKGVRNAAAVIYDGKLLFEYYKQHLPNYGVFDEKRYFEPGSENPCYLLGSTLFGVSICEDIWADAGPPLEQADKGARILINISGSPFYAGKTKDRMKVLARMASTTGSYIAYCNLVGGQDELVFDGQSLAIGPEGELIGRAKAFEQDLLIFDLPVTGGPTKSSSTSTIVDLGPTFQSRQRHELEVNEKPVPSMEDEVYEALVLGVRDYTRKNGFNSVVIGLSGGIDSSLTATIACDALGPENTICVAMPSEISSRESIEDARLLAGNLGMRLLEIPIGNVLESYLDELKGTLMDKLPNVTEENLQARIRGDLLMAISNKFGWLLLSTGNKSEMSVGYATLYGDMAGGLAVLKDVPKTMVYCLSRYRNQMSQKPVIPDCVIAKEPSAELSPGQRDTDTLPSYEVLDPILYLYVEEDKSVDEIVELGHDRETVNKVAVWVDKNEYKRRQSPPGIKITPKAFGRDRRMPITNRYSELNT